MRPPARRAHHVILALAAHREAAFRAAELAVERDHVVLGIPGVVDDDGARLGIVIAPVEPADLHRKAVFAVVIIAGDIGAVRARVGAEIVREALDEARMVGVGAAAVGDAVAFDLAAHQVDDVEARLARRLREVDDADRCRAATTLCASSAALALANSCGSMPPGADGVSTCARRRRRQPARADPASAGRTSDGRTLELAAEERIAPAAP